METAPKLRAEGVGKRFGATRALSDVSFDLHAGEVHGLIGENGAGKSTLTRLMAGVHVPDEGRLLLDGLPVTHWDPHAALEAGVVTVHQDVNLIETMTVAENVFLGCELRRRAGLDRVAMTRETAEILRALGIEAGPGDIVADLPTDQRKMVQLARAVRRKPRVLLLDEPTSSLTGAEVEVLMAQVRRIAASGIAVLYISHYLDEVFAVTDRLTILRDGMRVWSGPTGEIAKADAIAAMIGARLSAETAARRPPPTGAAPALSVRGLCLPGKLYDVSFDLNPGEILGIGGLAGAGLAELGRALVSDPAFRPSAGEIRKAGKRRDWRHPREAIADGVALVTSDRHRSGVLVDFSLADNIALPSLGRFTGRFGRLDRRAVRRAAEAGIAALSIKTTSPEAPLSSLSGGNQQKTMLAKWFATEPDILILDEPTLGVDIGAKATIKAHVRARATAGTAILLLTSELEDIADLADRAAIMFRGAIRTRLNHSELSHEALVAAAHNPDTTSEAIA